MTLCCVTIVPLPPLFMPTNCPRSLIAVPVRLMPLNGLLIVLVGDQVRTLFAARRCGCQLLRPTN